MTPENFVYWLQGFLEVSCASEMSEHQLRIVRDHLELVLSKKTPAYQMPTVTVNLPKWETTSNTSSAFPQGPKCGTCGAVTSEEGGTCRGCKAHASSFPVICDACGHQRTSDELASYRATETESVKICRTCRVEANERGDSSIRVRWSDLYMPYIDVPLFHTC